MKRNTVKMVCNPYTNRMSYYFRNELGEWEVLSSDSPLSRQYYTNTTVSEKVQEILEKIDEIYNRKNKGLDILFEGTNENYHILCETIEKNFYGKNINCKLGTTKIAVVGKKSAGKSYLIDGIENLQGFKYSKIKQDGYVRYVDECNHAEWYEITGIDLGKNKVEESYDTIKKLSKEGLSAVVYCIPATSGRIEEIEKTLIKRIETDFAEMRTMIALTMCFKDDIQEAIDEIEKITDQIKVVPVLAKEYKTALKDKKGNALVIDSFGLEDISRFVFEGR